MHPMVNPTLTTLLLCEWMSVPAPGQLAACSTESLGYSCYPYVSLRGLCHWLRPSGTLGYTAHCGTYAAVSTPSLLQTCQSLAWKIDHSRLT